MTPRPRSIRAVCTLAIACGTSAWAQEGKLDAVRDRVDGKSDSAWDSDSDGDDVEGFFELLDFVFEVPFGLPCAWLGDGNFARAGFLAYPNCGGAGYWLPADAGADDKRWTIRPRVEWGTDFDDLERTGLGLELEHANRLGLDFTWNRWREDLTAGTDELDLGDANFVVRFAQGPNAAFRAGLGLNYLADERDTDLGFNLTYGADFVGRWLSAGLETDLGTLGSASLFHLRGTLGLLVSRFELYAGFDWFDIEGVALDSYGFGLRGWF
jgi:hypothetical protein